MMDWIAFDKWLLRIGAGMTFLVLVILLIVLGFSAANAPPKPKGIYVELGEGEGVVGAASLQCEGIRFNAQEFSISTRSGIASIEEARCVLIKKEN